MLETCRAVSDEEAF